MDGCRCCLKDRSSEWSRRRGQPSTQTTEAARLVHFGAEACVEVLGQLRLDHPPEKET